MGKEANQYPPPTADGEDMAAPAFGGLDHATRPLSRLNPRLERERRVRRELRMSNGKWRRK